MRTVKAKGDGHFYTVIRRGSPNALLPILTLTGLAFADRMSGAVTTETIFAFPGIGLYSYEAATSLDFPVIMGVLLLVSAVYVLTNSPSRSSPASSTRGPAHTRETQSPCRPPNWRQSCPSGIPCCSKARRSW
jgi:ABC-type antimicrobial peptide transport system permease subunit